MKFSHIVNQVYRRPWLITPEFHASIRQVIEARLQGRAADLRDLLEPEDDSGVMSIENGLATIRVKGVMLRGATAIEKMCGACDVGEIEEAVATAAQSPDVTAILLDVDSPGGVVAGIPELGDTVAQASQLKDTYAFTDGMMASAAYWTAAGCKEIIASKAADIGSIGVYMPWIDESAALEAEGVTVEIIRNAGADLKGMGYPGTSLTESQRAQLQKEVDDIAKMFHAHVKQYRGNLSADTLRGQSFMALEAEERGLVDQIMSRRECLAAIRESL